MTPATGGGTPAALDAPPEGLNTYVIERDMPGAGKMDEEKLKEAATKSNEVLAGMSDIQWVQSYMTDDKVYCVYHAQNEDLVKKHADEMGIPANSIRQVATNIDPSTAGTAETAE